MDPIRVKQLLLMTVSAMEEACQDARRYAERIDSPEAEPKDLAFLAAQVNHSFTWGWANASCNLEQAFREIAKVVAWKSKADD